MSSKGDRLIRESESPEGQEVLRGILEGLSHKEFVDIAQAMLAVEPLSEDVYSIFKQEGSRRSDILLEQLEHEMAVLVSAASCSSIKFLEVARVGLLAHQEEGDPIRLKILELIGDGSSWLVAELGEQEKV